MQDLVISNMVIYTHPHTQQHICKHVHTHARTHAHTCTRANAHTHAHNNKTLRICISIKLDSKVKYQHFAQFKTVICVPFDTQEVVPEMFTLS